MISGAFKRARTRGSLICACLFVLSAAAADAQRHAITATDVASWKTIRGATLSRDGKWFAYFLQAREDDGELVLRATRSEDETRFPVGDGVQKFAFSADNRSLIYMVAPHHDATKSLSPFAPAANTLVVLDLTTQKKTSIDSIQSFTLDGERSRTLALEPYSMPSSDTSKSREAGRAVILYDIATASKVVLSNVRDFSFDSSGKWLAWTVDAKDQVGNGLHVRDLETGADRVLDEGRAVYRGLKWSAHSSDGLAVLRGTPDSARADTLNALLWYTQVSTNRATGSLFDPQHEQTFPSGMTIGATEPLRWSENNDAIFFGIRPIRERLAKTETSEKANLVLWHWNDARIQSQQQKEKTRDDAYTYLSVYRLSDKRFVRLADDSLHDVVVAPRGEHLIGWDVRAYARDDWLTGRHYVDLYALDTKTEARRLLAKRFLLFSGILGRTFRYFLSPDGVHVLTWDGSAYTVRDMTNGKSHPLLGKGGPSFGKQETDGSPHNIQIEPQAWSRDGAMVILSDGWDLWRIPINGEAPSNLTVDGKKTATVYGRPVAALMGLEPIIGSGTAAIDLSKPWYVEARAKWAKENGFARIDGVTPGAHRLLWREGTTQGWPIKAHDADVVAVTHGTSVGFPDYYVTDLSFANLHRVTDANPQQRDLLWPSGTMVVDYKGPAGERLQAAVLLPANYEKGKRYPAIMTIYEIESGLRNYFLPLAEVGPGTGVEPVRYASRGYVIIFPDIDYAKAHPGTSALTCVLGAARAAVAAGVVDSTRVGLTGHSWGGYESSFIPTQTSFFAAVLTAAPITDMVSEYGGIYWGNGQPNSGQGDSDQLRMAMPYWLDPQSYIRESPVFHVDKVTTPILIVHNDKDDAVDWRQGVEYYNALRRARKPVVMLEYVGQGHSTGGTANLKDLGRRAQEFFDHFLMGAPAPKWWTDGMPSVQGTLLR